MKKILLLLTFFIITPLNVGISFFTLQEIQKNKPVFNSFTHVSSQLFASIPESVGEVLGTFTTEDARPVIIEKYLKKHKSPLLPYVRQLLEASERYNVDYRLIVAIAQCESNLCKRAPAGSYNCWGFENGETRFLSWEQALNQVAKTLRERYLDQGLTTPEQIMPKYAPPSVEKGGPWAKCVNQFIEELEYGKVD
jgi:hypothetical protein